MVAITTIHSTAHLKKDHSEIQVVTVDAGVMRMGEVTKRATTITVLMEETAVTAKENLMAVKAPEMGIHLEILIHALINT